MKKRTIALLTLLVVWSAIAYADFATNGGWVQLFRENVAIKAPVDTVIRTCTLRIYNVTKSRMECDTVTPPSQWARLQFWDGSNKDTIRYSQRLAIGTTRDTIFIRTDSLSANTASTDSVIVQFYSNIVKVDTVISTVMKEAPSFFKNAFLARAVELSNLDCTGVFYVVQTRIGDNDAWASIATLGLMTETDSAIAKNDTLASSNLFFGNQYRVLRIFVDSVGGAVRTTTLQDEVWWRGLR